MAFEFVDNDMYLDKLTRKSTEIYNVCDSLAKLCKKTLEEYDSLYVNDNLGHIFNFLARKVSYGKYKKTSKYLKKIIEDFDLADFGPYALFISAQFGNCNIRIKCGTKRYSQYVTYLNDELELTDRIDMESLLYIFCIVVLWFKYGIKKEYALREYLRMISSECFDCTDHYEHTEVFERGVNSCKGAERLLGA